MLASFKEPDSRPGNEVPDGAGYEYFARVGQRTHPGGDMHRQTAEVVTANLAFARVQSRPEVET